MRKVLQDRLLFWALVLFLLSGCAFPHYTLVCAEQTFEVGPFRVRPASNWSKTAGDPVEAWTVDGPQLQTLIFFKGIRDSKPLIVKKRGDKDDMPFFRSDMSGPEVMELFDATWTRLGRHQVAMQGLRPAKFAGLDGFRFEFRYVTESGLEYQGFTVGTIRSGRLLAVTYMGTALHHFAKHERDAEQVIASLRLR
jgi:hypothetical protein